MKNILEIQNLKVEFKSDFGIVRAVDGISLSVSRKKTLCLVGESGCGKSVASLSVLRLLPSSARISDGKILFDSKDGEIDLTKTSSEALQKIRGGQIAMIFQEPMTSLNPVFTIGFQLDEAIFAHYPQMSAPEIREKSLFLLKKVGIPREKSVYESYPHELSGGMRQRIMIAMAISCEPDLIIADEPTTALDVTVQAQILELLADLQRDLGMAMIFITHDLGVVAEIADEIAVMYAGKIVERSRAEEIFLRPAHPYTQGLLRCAEKRRDEETGGLFSIKGAVPNMTRLEDGCRFCPRCEKFDANFCKKEPPLLELSEGHFVACCRAAKF